MFKLVLHSYKNQFKSGLKNCFSDGGWWVYLYALCMPFIIMDMEHHTFLIMTAMLPLLLGLLLSRMYPNEMSKALLLCPMDERERIAYIKTGYFLRCAFPLLLFLIVNGTLVIIGYLPLLHFAGVLLVEFFFITGVNIYREPVVKSTSAYDKKYDLPGAYEVWNVLLQMSGVAGTFMFVSDVPEPGAVYEIPNPNWRFDVVMMSLVMLGIFLIWLKMVKTYYKPVMERAVSMECTIKSAKNGKSVSGLNVPFA